MSEGTPEQVLPQVAASSAPPPSEIPSPAAAVASGASPTVVDADALLARLQAMEAQLAHVQSVAQAAQDAATPKAPSLLELITGGNLSGAVAHAFGIVEERLVAVEKHLGI